MMGMTARALQQEPIYYPDSDGEPMAEGDSQRDSLVYLVEALKDHFKDQPQVYVSGNLLIYYEEGNPRRSVAPDVFVVFDVPKYSRNIYQTWVEGKGPDVVIEITSHTTRQNDEKLKPVLYQQLGVQEYYQYDPSGLYLKPALRGRTLDDSGIYKDMTTIRGLDRSVILNSELLGLQFRLEAGQLRVFEPRTKTYLFTYSEERQQKKQALQQVEQERQRAEQERQQKEQALQRAEKLAAQLRALGIDPDKIR
jgi:Uma2 family endonuclease